jgi:hypothetical protein
MNGAELSWFDRLKIFVTPKSYAEATIDAMYGPEGRGLIPLPETYEPERAAEPAAYVEAVQTVGSVVTRAQKAVQSSFIKIGIIAFVAIAALVAINAFMRR